jgi:hypothetical protein
MARLSIALALCIGLAGCAQAERLLYIGRRTSSSSSVDCGARESATSSTVVAKSRSEDGRQNRRGRDFKALFEAIELEQAKRGNL